MSDYDSSDVNQLPRVLRHQEADRLPHIELWVTSQAVYESVWEHQLDYEIGDAAEWVRVKVFTDASLELVAVWF